MTIRYDRLLASIAICCGCAADVGTPQGVAADSGSQFEVVDSDDVAQSSLALSTTIGEGPFNWDSTFIGPTQLKPSSSHFCVLTRAAGNFRGIETVRVFDQSDGFWYLGDQGPKAVQASAFCFRLSAFSGPSPTAKFWDGNDDDANGAQLVFAPWSATDWNPNNEFTRNTIDLYQGDAASMLSGISGVWNGDREFAEIAQSNDPWGFSKLSVGTATDDWTTGYASSLFVGVAQSGHVAKFIGPNGIVGDAGTSREFVARAGSSVFMAPANQAMCYFTRLSGTFQSTAHLAEITLARDASGVERWRLRSNISEARARCYKLDQR
jgi:hypothetical protein